MHRYHLKKMDKYFDNNEELLYYTIGNSKGQRAFQIVSKIKFVFGKKTKDEKPRKDMKPIPGATHSKSSLFSLSICHIGKSEMYATQSMVCT